jgi:hypothetical protein
MWRIRLTINIFVARMQSSDTPLKILRKKFMRNPFRLSLLLLFLSVLVMTGSAQGASSVYGQTLVQTIDIPKADIARFERFNLSPTDKSGRPKTSTGLQPDTEDWLGKEMHVSSQNPYNIVIKTKGAGISDGEATLRWQPRWDVASGVVGTIIGGVSKKVSAGQPIELIAASGPLRFKRDVDIAPIAGFVKSNNLRIDSVKVEIWSGIANPGFLDMLGPLSGLLVGVIMLVLVIWFRRG